jgi:hypothetical protein
MRVRNPKHEIRSKSKIRRRKHEQPAPRLGSLPAGVRTGRRGDAAAIFRPCDTCAPAVSAAALASFCRGESVFLRPLPRVRRPMKDERRGATLCDSLFKERTSREAGVRESATLPQPTIISDHLISSTPNWRNDTRPDVRPRATFGVTGHALRGFAPPAIHRGVAFGRRNSKNRTCCEHSGTVSRRRPHSKNAACRHAPGRAGR